MKKYFLLILLAGAIACQDNTTTTAADEKIKEGTDNVKEGIDMKVDSAGEYLKDEKVKAEEKINARIKEIDTKIEELKKDGSKKSAEARVKLEATRDGLNKKLVEIKNSTVAAWEITKRDAERALDKADKEWLEFQSDFKELFR